MKPRWTGGAYLALLRLFDGSDRRIGGVRHLEMATPLLCDPLMLPTAAQPLRGGREKRERGKMRAFLGCSGLLRIPRAQLISQLIIEEGSRMWVRI